MTEANPTDPFQGLQVTGLGQTQHVPGDRLQRAGERFEADLTYAEKAQEHVWIVTVARTASPSTPPAPSTAARRRSWTPSRW